ncbi:MAG: CBS domain-containing protein, partial [Candidatus Binatia bacterium]
MSAPRPITVSTADSCQWALRAMSAANVDRLAVLEGDRVVGIVTDRDIYRLATRMLSIHRDDASFLACARVSGVMTYLPVTLSPATQLVEAIEALLETEGGALPVVDHGEFCGLVTTTDLLHAALSMLE